MKQYNEEAATCGLGLRLVTRLMCRLLLPFLGTTVRLLGSMEVEQLVPKPGLQLGLELGACRLDGAECLDEGSLVDILPSTGSKLCLCVNSFG